MTLLLKLEHRMLKTAEEETAELMATARPMWKQYSNNTRIYIFVWPASSRFHKQNVQIGFWKPSAAWIRKATLWLQQCRVLGRHILSSCANRCGSMVQKSRKTWKNNKQAAYRYDYVYVYVCFLYSKYMLQSLRPSFPPAQRCRKCAILQFWRAGCQNAAYLQLLGPSSREC